jgi:hypothetical protein
MRAAAFQVHERLRAAWQDQHVRIAQGQLQQILSGKTAMHRLPFVCTSPEMTGRFGRRHSNSKP